MNTCEGCGGELAVWFTDNGFWNAVRPQEGNICIQCFIEEAERKYQVVRWRVTPEFAWKPMEAKRD